MQKDKFMTIKITAAEDTIATKQSSDKSIKANKKTILKRQKKPKYKKFQHNIARVNK